MLQEVGGQPELLSIQESQAQPGSPLTSQPRQPKVQSVWSWRKQRQFQPIGFSPSRNRRVFLQRYLGPEHPPGHTVDCAECVKGWLPVPLNSGHLPKATSQDQAYRSTGLHASLFPVPDPGDR